ncbi:MAG: sulfatase-like hydrolase/transferase [Sphingobacterium sp.]
MLKTLIQRPIVLLNLILATLFGARNTYAQAHNMNSEKSGKSRPNIILIVAESHRAEALGTMGNPFVETPHLDQLASQGTQFNNAYVTSAICVVSRASMLSGQHVSRHGINTFASNFSETAFQETFPMLLKDAGYQLAWLGWYGVGTPPSTDNFDLWNVDIPWMENGLHHTDNLTQQAGQWLESYPGDQPFFLQLNYSAAHEIDPKENVPAHFLVQERHQDRYADVEIPTPKSAAASVWSSFPDFFRTPENIARARWYGFFDTANLMQQSTRDYYRLITGLDEAVGDLRSKLATLNLDDNTIIIYTSDHGFSLGEHGLMGKWFPFEQNIRVPLLIYNPLTPTFEKQESSSIALNIDIAPTILALAQAAIPATMQGKNLADVMDGRTAERKHFFYEHPILGSPQLPVTQAVVSREMKYILFPEHGFEMLYDLNKDRDEIDNLAADPHYQETLSRMRQQLENGRAAAK